MCVSASARVTASESVSASARLRASESVRVRTEGLGGGVRVGAVMSVSVRDVRGVSMRSPQCVLAFGRLE